MHFSITGIALMMVLTECHVGGTVVEVKSCSHQLSFPLRYRERCAALCPQRLLNPVCIYVSLPPSDIFTNAFVKTKTKALR